MAEGTRLSQLTESVKECQDAWAQQQIFNTNFTQKIDDLTTLVQTVLTNQGRPPEPPPDDRNRLHPPPEHPPGDQPGVFLDQDDRLFPGPLRQQQEDHRQDCGERWFLDDDFPEFPRGERPIHARAMRLDFPRFDGNNPAAWTYKANQFFDYYQIPLYHRTRMASFHMDGEALIWFQDADEAGQFPTWDSFTQALLIRFRPAFDDPKESLVHLRHSTSVAEYTAQFESLSNRLRGLSDKYKLSYFLSGLKDEIRLPLRMLAPRTLVSAFGLAKLQEEYLQTSRKSSRTFSGSSAYSQASFSSSSSGPSSGQQSPLPVQRISPTQMRERREKGLCYNCDDKWHLAHKCKPPKLFLMSSTEPLPNDTLEDLGLDHLDKAAPVLEPIIQEVVDPEITLHAISGSLAPKTMCFFGSIRSKKLVILLDSDSTHNFINLAAVPVAFLGPLTPLQSRVRVANGETLLCTGKCNSVSIRVQGTTITADFYLLPLGGCNIVLGVDWLRSLGPVLWDFSCLTMQF
jgi:hypothetical protein